LILPAPRKHQGRKVMTLADSPCLTAGYGFVMVALTQGGGLPLCGSPDPGLRRRNRNESQFPGAGNGWQRLPHTGLMDWWINGCSTRGRVERHRRSAFAKLRRGKPHFLPSKYVKERCVRHDSVATRPGYFSRGGAKVIVRHYRNRTS